MSAEIADVLDRAADRIERDGLWKGSYYQGSRIDLSVAGSGLHTVRIRLHETPQPCCAIAALVAESDDFGDALNALRTHLEFGNFDTIMAWSDDPRRPGAEVVAALRGAAAQERAS